MKANKRIFDPIKIGPVVSKNRIEVAPAAPFLTGHDSSVSPEFYEYTMNLAKSGAGIVTIGVSSVEPGSLIGARTLNVSSPLYLPDLNDLAEGIHRYGALANIELVHSKYMLSDPMEVVNNTTTADVEEAIRLFAAGAAICKAAGFDMIMIHGGHGNVPSMFFNKKFNNRTDRFGGSFENRCNFGIELLKAIRESTQGTIGIEYRISAEEILPGMTTFEETLAYAKVIEPYIDLLHVSRGLLEEDSLLPIINAPVYLPKAMNLPFAKKFKEELSIPVTVVGSMDLDNAEEAISRGDIDMASMIRTVLADTNCVNKARVGKDEDIRPCLRCNVCISRTHSSRVTIRCAVNPVVGRETRFDTVNKAPQSKKVVIVGGGPAGLEAARTCSKRGHKVVLFEANDELGGNFRLACAADSKKELRRYLAWSTRTVSSDDNIEVRLNTRATPDIVKKEAPDAVIVAIGAEPIIPKFSGLGTDKVIWVGDAENCGADLGDEIIVAGAGFTGMEFALEMSRQGKKVKIIDMLPEEKIGAGGSPINLICLKDLLKEGGVEFICEAKIEDITKDGVEILCSNGEKSILPCDTAVLSLGFRKNMVLLDSFEETAEDCYYIGDCSSPTGGNVALATSTAFDKAMQI